MEAQELYGLPLAQFTAQRNALARDLRQQGKRDEAAAVAKLRKPSVTAWAVNQLVRTQPRDVDALLKAGDALERTQAELVAKRGDPSTLRQAVETERAAVDRLLEKARGLLDSDGHELTAPRLAQVAETLHAAALDDDARASVRDGCLERELRHVGIGSLEGLGAAPTPRRGSRRGAGAPRAQRASRRQKPATGQEQARASRQERAAAERAAREAEATARRRLERVSRQQRTAERRRERAAAELRDAEQALAAARDAAAQAESELQRTKRLLDDL